MSKKGRLKGLPRLVRTDWSINLCEALQSAEIVSIPVGTEGESVLLELETEAVGEMAKFGSPTVKTKKSKKVVKGEVKAQGLESDQNVDGQEQEDSMSADEDSPIQTIEDVIIDEKKESKEDNAGEEAAESEEEEEQISLEEVEAGDESGPEKYDQRAESMATENLDKKLDSQGDKGGTIEEGDGKENEGHKKVIVLRNAEHEANGNALLLQTPIDSECQNRTDELGDHLAAASNRFLSNANAQKDSLEATEERPLLSSTLDGQVVDVQDITRASVVVMDNDGKEPISEVDRVLFEALKGFIESQAEEAKGPGEWAKVSNPEQDVSEPFDPLLQPNPVYAINTPAMVKYREHKNEAFLKKLHRASTESSGQTTICEICGSILSLKQIKKHLKSIHSSEARVRKHECKTCGRKFFKTDSLVRHERTHFEPTFKCKHCDKRFRHNFQLRNHERTHMGYQPPKRIHKPRYKTLNPKPRHSVKNIEIDNTSDVAKCEICGSQMNSRSIRRHMLMQHADVEIGSHPCDKCERKFSTASRLKTHLLTHEGLRFGCTFCDTVLHDDLARVKHERSHLPEEERERSVKYKCGYCVKTYSRVRDRLQHEMSHFDPSIDLSHGARKRTYQTSTKMVTCEICNKVLKQTSMKCHMDSHSGKTWTCQVCGKTISKGARYDHMKLHTDKKDHCCSHCTAKFHTKHALVAHLRKHTKEKPIPCRYCDRMFSRYEGRNNHERSHTGLRPYRCDLCDKSWKDRPTYSQHMKKYHPGV